MSAMECPWCKSVGTVFQETYDFGVAGPLGCDACHAVQMAPNDTASTPFQREHRWHEGDDLMLRKIPTASAP